MRHYRQKAASGTAALVALWAALPQGCPENESLWLIPDQCIADEFVQNQDGTSDFDCTIVWADPAWAQVGGAFSISFDISGVMQHITQSQQTLWSGAPSGTAPNFNGAIGVNADHSVGGTDITIPATQVVYDCAVNPSIITNAWIANAAYCVGKVANAAILGFQQGEVLLSRVSGKRSSGQLYSISFGFSILQNATNFYVGATGSGSAVSGGVLVPLKKGWDYLWCYYEPGDNVSQNGSASSGSAGAPYVILPQLKGVYVEQVLQTADYSVLGISALSIAGTNGAGS